MANKSEQSKIPIDVDFSVKDVTTPTIVTEVSSTRPSTGYSETTRPSTSTTNTSISTNLGSIYTPDLSKDLFTPTTYKALDLEIARNSDNISDLDKTISDEGVKNSVLDKLMDERRYLLEQKGKHLSAILQLSKNTSIDDVDSDKLHKEISLLKQRTDSLYTKSINNSSRLDVVEEEHPGS